MLHGGIFRNGYYLNQIWQNGKGSYSTTDDSAINIPRANGAKRRSGRKPGARVTNSALAFTYIRIMRCYIAQWHSGIKSRRIFWIWTLDGFRCFAHARVSSS